MTSSERSTQTPDAVDSVTDSRPEVARSARTEIAARRLRLAQAQAALAARLREQARCPKALPSVAQELAAAVADAQAEVTEAARRLRVGIQTSGAEKQ